jgi:hypothetical protein
LVVDGGEKLSCLLNAMHIDPRTLRTGASNNGTMKTWTKNFEIVVCNRAERVVHLLRVPSLGHV